MVYKIEKEQYDLVKSVLDESVDNIEVKAVLDGTNPGTVYVDCVESPRTAVIYSQGNEGYYFVGDYGNRDFLKEFNGYIDANISPLLRNSDINGFEFSGETEQWCSALENTFADRTLKISKQYIYKLCSDSWDGYQKSSLKEGYELREIANKLHEDKSITNMEFLSDELLKWWDSWDDYDELAFGYCIVHDNKIVSFCMCDYVYEKVRPLGIETLKEYRRQGLCQAAVEAYIERCIENGLKPYWECMQTNVASRSLAEKLGFTRTKVYTLYSFRI